jgi:ribonuclease HII
LFEVERQAFSQGYTEVAGVDEAGRGPLAGPVVAAACILPPDHETFPYLNDSKQLSKELRETLYRDLTAHPEVKIGVGMASHEEIDEINIYQAALKAMRLAVQNLPALPKLLLIDGLLLPPYHAWKIADGDALSLSIAAASVIAKVTRDRLMCEYHEKWPCYGFDKHKGYGTPAHLEALEEHGPCPIHRRSFAPVKSMMY